MPSPASDASQQGFEAVPAVQVTGGFDPGANLPVSRVA